MKMNATLRRLTCTVHLISSIGWIGAALVFLSLAVVGVTSRDEATVRGAYLVMAPAAWFVLIPLAHTSFVSGVALSLGTRWGLVRHYWIVLKLAITASSTVVLLIYTATFDHMADTAADARAPLELVRNPSPIVHALLALVLLSFATVLGIYKPFGMTPYGERSTPALASPLTYWLYAVTAIILLAAILHRLGTGFTHQGP
jgi:hypothetical protein